MKRGADHVPTVVTQDDPSKMVGEGRCPTPNRKYYRQPDETRLYT